MENYSPVCIYLFIYIYILYIIRQLVGLTNTQTNNKFNQLTKVLLY